MKKLLLLLFVFVVGTGSFTAHAQRHKIAVFTPLYLDSAFTYSGAYAFNKAFPRFLSAGVEFYQGVQWALDSLQKAGAPLEVFIYDIKSKATPLAQQLRRPELAGVEMIIAQSNAAETKMLADVAQARKIPFISATLPNDMGIENNPYTVILNTTLHGHVEGLYRMLQKFYSLDKIIVFRKSGGQEDVIKNHLAELGKTTASVPLNIKFVDVGAGIDPQILAREMDSTRRNVIVAGSMDEAFGTKLAQGLSVLNKSYPLTLVGMPTWDNFNFNKPEFKSLEIIYSSPFYYNRQTSLESRIATEFEKQANTRPSDLFFRGYETALRFALLLLDAKKDVASNLTRKGNYIFTRFDIQPVFKDKSNMTLDYFENKNLYFIRVSGGVKRLM